MLVKVEGADHAPQTSSFTLPIVVSGSKFISRRRPLRNRNVMYVWGVCGTGIWSCGADRGEGDAGFGSRAPEGIVSVSGPVASAIGVGARGCVEMGCSGGTCSWFSDVEVVALG